MLQSHFIQLFINLSKFGQNPQLITMDNPLKSYSAIKKQCKIHPETEENAQKCTGENGSRMSQSHFNGTFVGFWSCSTKLASHYFMHFDSRKEQDHRGIPPSYTGGVLRDHKVEKILKGSLDSIPSPSPSAKIQIMGGKVCFRCKGKTLLAIANQLLKTKSLF